MVEPLRILFIGPSIRSDWRNPAAHLHRAVMRGLNERGHQTRFLEARRNPAVEGLLAERGSAALLEFDREFADIDYYSYDPLPRRELLVWIGREGATTDMMILLDGMGIEIEDAFGRTEILGVGRLVEQPDASGSALVEVESRTPVTRYAAVDPALSVVPVRIAEAIERAGFLLPTPF